MLQLLNLLQWVLYIPLLALLGQGVLFVLAGRQWQQNFFYQLLQLLSRPFTALVRRATPAKIPDRHVPVATFGLVLVGYAVVTLEKISLCMRIGMELCR